MTADIHRHNHVCYGDFDSVEVHSSYIVVQMALLGFNVRRLGDIAVTTYVVLTQRELRRKTNGTKGMK